LQHLDEWNALRRKWAARYSAGLHDAANIQLPYEAPGNYHVYHLYVVETKQPERRDSLLIFLTAHGIDAKCHYPDRHSPAGRLPLGQAGPHRRSCSQLRAQRRLLCLTTYVS